MKTLALLRNPIQPYAWGSREAIARLQGRPAPAAEPEAELWMGAHPRAPSEIQVDGRWVSLLHRIQLDPDAVLGAPVARAFQGRLPFLFKVLAAERALSLQAHPDMDQACDGFARENAQGIPLCDPSRCYSDASHKPELVCALTRFTALRGFREPGEIARRLGDVAGRALARELEPLRERPDGIRLRGLFEALLGLDAGRRRRVLAEAVAGAEAAGEGDADLAWVRRLAQEHPGDIGALAPLLLHRIELEPGEAMFLPPGELHAYLGGVAVELMASSDNVLRGGLTAKHVSVPELLRVLRFEAGPPAILRPQARSPGVRAYATPAAEFELAEIEVRNAAPVEGDPERSVEILLCVDGRAHVTDLGGGPSVPLPRGAAAIVPASVPRYRIEGDATLYRASVPAPAPRD